MQNLCCFIFLFWQDHIFQVPKVMLSFLWCQVNGRANWKEASPTWWPESIDVRNPSGNVKVTVTDANTIISSYLTFFADFVVTREETEEGGSSSINRMKTGVSLPEEVNHCLSLLFLRFRCQLLLDLNICVSKKAFWQLNKTINNQIWRYWGRFNLVLLFF